MSGAIAACPAVTAASAVDDVVGDAIGDAVVVEGSEVNPPRALPPRDTLNTKTFTKEPWVMPPR